MKSYSESSFQTIQTDPDGYLENYGNRKLVSNSGCQTETSLEDDFLQPEGVATEMDDESDSDSSVDNEEELQRRLNPTTPQDFETLQSELLQWRRREERKIAITARTEEHRQEMRRLLLKKEAHILRKIEQLKNSATDKWKTERIEHTMDTMGRPKQWEISDGSIVGVDTPETHRAREMRAMYDELNESVERAATRIELLGRIKAFVDAIDHCGLAKDVSSLLDRELQMLRRGTDLGPEFMDGMRKRLSNQFTKLVTRLNSETAGIGRVPHAPATKAKFELQRPNTMK
ncbi:hypothetical protein ACHAWF_016898 [Thalassiosira exigua]